jgi:hypothetical protein
MGDVPGQSEAATWLDSAPSLTGLEVSPSSTGRIGGVKGFGVRGTLLGFFLSSAGNSMDRMDGSSEDSGSSGRCAPGPTSEVWGLRHFVLTPLVRRRSRSSGPCGRTGSASGLDCTVGVAGAWEAALANGL